jgi:hypothetical protein
MCESGFLTGSPLQTFLLNMTCNGFEISFHSNRQMSINLFHFHGMKGLEQKIKERIVNVDQCSLWAIFDLMPNVSTNCIYCFMYWKFESDLMKSDRKKQLKYLIFMNNFFVLFIITCYSYGDSRLTMTNIYCRAFWIHNELSPSN